MPGGSGVSIVGVKIIRVEKKHGIYLFEKGRSGYLSWLGLGFSTFRRPICKNMKKQS